MTKNNSQLFPSELRFDQVSGDWVVIATGRARRPSSFKKKRKEENPTSPDECPFCQIQNQDRPTLVFAEGKRFLGKGIPENWTTAVIPNKYPAFLPYPKLEERQEGPYYKRMNAVGFHEVVITRDHEKSLGQFNLKQVKEVIDVYHQRYLDLMGKKFVNHISIFHNHGREAGASIYHPHSQIITTPLIDIDLKKALNNSGYYYKKDGKCVYCQMNEWELKEKKRIIFENNNFMAFCPFASKSAFQVIISPKPHLSYFERIDEQQKIDLAEAFQKVMKKIYRGLSNPAYNFYLHTAPCDGQDHPHYHWHWTIRPKTSTWAGFELGFGMEISTITPEEAAKYLRNQ